MPGTMYKDFASVAAMGKYIEGEKLTLSDFSQSIETFIVQNLKKDKKYVRILFKINLDS